STERIAPRRRRSATSLRAVADATPVTFARALALARPRLTTVTGRLSSAPKRSTGLRSRLRSERTRTAVPATRSSYSHGVSQSDVSTERTCRAFETFHSLFSAWARRLSGLVRPCPCVLGIELECGRSGRRKDPSVNRVGSQTRGELIGSHLLTSWL